MKVIKVTLVIHKVNMFSEKYPVEIKFNFVSRRQKCQKDRKNCRLKVAQKGFKSARTDDASFSNVRALADASSCKSASKSTI